MVVHTRQEFLDNQIDASQYYGQFVTNDDRAKAKELGVDCLCNAGDGAFWQFTFGEWSAEILKKINSAEDHPSKQLRLIVLREAAKQIRDFSCETNY